MTFGLWLLGAACAFLIGAAKTGVTGAGTLIIPFMVFLVGDARHAAAWTAPLLSTGDVFAVIYWRRHADAKKLFSLIPWVAVGMVGGAFALTLNDYFLRRMIGVIILAMLALHLAQRRGWVRPVERAAMFYGMAAGFATTIANVAGPIMSMYLLTRRLSKEQFVATGAWFFFVVNLAKIPIYAWQGLFSRQSLVFNAAMAPVVVLGGLAGLVIIRRIPQRIFESMVLILSAVSAIFLFR